MKMQSLLMLLVMLILALVGTYYSSVEQNALGAITRFMGMGTFFLLCISLIIGPLAVIDNKFLQLIEARRSIGLSAFVFLIMHFYLVISAYFNYKFAFLTARIDNLTGLIAFVLFIVLALTSCDYAIKKLGSGLWKKIQYLTYIAFVFGFYHYATKASGPSITGIEFMPWNWAELFLILLAFATIALQIVGIYLRKKRNSAVKK